MNRTTHAPARSARNNRKVAVVRRSAGNAGAIIGTSTKNGELMTVDEVRATEKAPVVAARKMSAGVGSTWPDAATERSTASVAMRTSYAAMKKPMNGLTSRRRAAENAWSANRTSVNGQS